MLPSTSRSLAKMRKESEGGSTSDRRKLIGSTNSDPLLVRLTDQKGVGSPSGLAITLHPRASLPVASVHVMSSVVDVESTTSCCRSVVSVRV